MRMIVLLSLMFNLLIGAEYAIVTKSALPKLSKQQIRAIYLKKLTLLSDTVLVPINLPSNSPIRKSFERKILRMTHSRLKAYWTKQHYLGHRPPIKMKSQESVKAFVKKIDGALGYVELSNVDKDLNILFKWSD